MGVIGAGRIGKHVIRIARGFEMNVLVYDRHPDILFAKQIGFEYVKIEDVLKKSDIVTLHIPYFKENYHFINKKRIGLMKKGVILINTARGAIIDTSALVEALDNGKVAGAGLDVIEGENLIKEEREFLQGGKTRKELELLAKDHELFRRENVVFTPHIAFYSKEALDRIIDKTIENIKVFEKGKIDKESFVVM